MVRVDWKKVSRWLQDNKVEPQKAVCFIRFKNEDWKHVPFISNTVDLSKAVGVKYCYGPAKTLQF